MRTPAVLESLENRRLLAAAGRVIDSDSYAMVDANHDDKADLIMPVRGGLGVMLGSGDGSFTPAQRIDLPTVPTRVAAGDVNNDGVADIVATSGNGIIAILIGLQSPAPGALFDDPFFFDAGAALRSGPDNAFRSGDVSMIIGDFDGDGTDELGFIDQRRGIIRVLIASLQSPTSFEDPVFIASPFGPRVQVAGGDVNGDGTLDLVGLDQRGSVHLAVGESGGIWNSSVIDLFPPRIRVDHVTAGDTNGDGIDEVIAIANGRVRGAFIDDTGPSLIVNPINLGTVPRAIQNDIIVVDIDGDADGELFALIRTRNGILPYMEQIT